MPASQTLGHVLTVTGSQMTVGFEHEGAEREIRIGDMVKVETEERTVVGTIAEVRFADEGGEQTRMFVVDLMGEIYQRGGEPEFTRGVSFHPAPGDAVLTADDADLNVVYNESARANLAVGTLHHDPSRPACILTDELLNMHFAVLGTSGSGKSCSISLILGAVLDNHPNAHIVMFDPHNEYSRAFGDRAEVLSVDTLNLPLWLFNLEELVNVLVRGGSDREQESQAIILKDAIIWARRYYAGDDYGATSITADTPVPFRVHELVRYINDEMGRLSKPDTSIPYLRLRMRIESLRGDRRYSFLFGAEEDTLTDIIGRLLRMPVNGRPMSIVDLSGVPSEIADVVVSVLTRVIFDFSMWSRR
ncbi:MAG TPA: ATP-binding protein, partial [Candidatus Tumulicola sp.]|nr:ATP-binding protein [Candidatus Tumulicola sp.]